MKIMRSLVEIVDGRRRMERTYAIRRRERAARRETTVVWSMMSVEGSVTADMVCYSMR